MVTQNSCDYQPTQYNVITGGASGTINNVAPSATSGVPVISQGASAQPIFGTTVVAGGGTGNVSATAYALQAGGTTSTGNHQSLATGTSGQILSSGGSGALPTWVASSIVGALVLLSSQTASSSASINFTSLISATYNTYLFIWSNVYPGTNASALNILLSTNNGSSYISTNYVTGTNRWVYNTGTFTNSSTTAGYSIGFTQSSTTTNQAANGYAYLYNMQNSGIPTYISFPLGYSTSSSALSQAVNVGSNTSNTNPNAIQAIFTAGTIAQGVFSLYGILE